MTASHPGAPGWYPVARDLQRWWDGTSWTDELTHRGRRTTVTAARRSASFARWAWVAVGVVAWVIFLTLSATMGVSTAFVLMPFPVIGTGAILFGAIAGGRMLRALPPSLAH